MTTSNRRYAIASIVIFSTVNAKLQTPEFVFQIFKPHLGQILAMKQFLVCLGSNYRNLLVELYKSLEWLSIILRSVEM